MITYKTILSELNEAKKNKISAFLDDGGYHAETHAVVYHPKNGEHKVIKKSNLDSHKAKGWKERHTIAPIGKWLESKKG